MSAQKTIDIGYRPRKFQAWLHNMVARVTVILLVCHRRFGKTIFAIAEILDKGLSNERHNPQYAYIAPTYSQAKKVAWDYLKDYMQDVPGNKFSEKDLKAVIPRGKDKITIYLLGAENPDSIRGIYLDGCVLDEYADMKPELYTKVVKPALSDRKGWAIFIGTVKGRNHFYKLFTRYTELMKKRPEKYFVSLLKSSETGVFDKEELDDLREEIGEEAFMQEYECDWSVGDAATYFGGVMQRVREQSRITRVPYDPLYPVDLFFDLGMNDSTAIWFRQTVGREFRYIDYAEDNGLNIAEWVGEVRKRGYRLGRVVLPHDAAQRELSTGTTRQEAFYASGLRTEIQPKQSLQDGIEAVRNHLNKSIFDAEKCEKGIECLENYRKKWDEKNQVYLNKPVHDRYSHGADAFRYASLDERPSEEEMQMRRSSLPSGADTDYDIFNY